MSKTGRHLTNVAFRAKVLNIIDKLKGTESFPIAKRTDDFEALNIDTFQVYMDALTEAVKPVPEPEPPPPPYEAFCTNFDIRLVMEGDPENPENPTSRTCYLYCNHTPEEIVSNIKNTFVNLKFSEYFNGELVGGPWEVGNMTITNMDLALTAYTSMGFLFTPDGDLYFDYSDTLAVSYFREEEGWYIQFKNNDCMPVWFNPEEAFPPVLPELPEPITTDGGEG